MVVHMYVTLTHMHFHHNIHCVIGLVLQLSVVSRNANSLSIMWERPSYYDGTITALIQYRALPNGDAMWLYVVDSGDTLPVLAELTEFTNYSVQMAAFDSTNTLCIFSQPIFALTGIYTYIYIYI